MRFWVSSALVASFGPVAPVYDELMESVPYRMWAGYYLLLLSQQEVRPRRMLDVCCGTGTMCELLTEEGFELSGFDISEAMIRQARQKARRRGLDIRYEVADASSFDMGDQFDAAFSFFDSLNYITEPAKLAAALQRVGLHLPAGGSFVFDLNTAYAFEQSLFDQRQLRDKSRIRYEWKGEYDPSTKLIEVRMRFWKGRREFEEVHVQRAYDDDEVRSMLAAAGFSNVRSYHSYTLTPPRRRSDRVHYTCIKGR